ncbi:MAG: tRNA (N(6)-L-threonylcarbamoyladenosine(37)-C(2))-methylthiotransferase MtaB [Chitinophagales bacterium]
MGLKVAFRTLGCKVNQYDTEAVAGLFRRAGYEVVDFAEAADVYVVNTCTVTSLGDKKSRQALRRAARLNPAAVIVAMGCYAQSAPDELAQVEGVDVVLGTTDRARLLPLVEEARRRKAGEAAAAAAVPERVAIAVRPLAEARIFEELGVGGLAEHTRATIKVQEGCRQFCSYCRVPHVRGPERSRGPEQVLAEVRRLVAEGFPEIVLTGIHLGSYGRDLAPAGPGAPAWNLARLASEVSKVPGLRRLRLSSIEPTDVTEELIGLVAESPVLCRHFHLPLQSGTDRTLQRMNRHYTTAAYAAVVERIRAAVPEAALTTDVIVGFPGESEADFAQTLAFVRQQAFSRLHVFPYSRRRGTPAAAFPDQVPEEVKRERASRLIALGQDLALAYHRRMVGTTVDVLFEEKQGSGGRERWRGLTDTYVRATVPSQEPLAAQIRRVLVSDATAEEVRGRLSP